MKKKAIIILLSLFVVLSCKHENNNDAKRLIGFWAIDHIVVDGRNGIFDINGNTMSFYENNTCDLHALNRRVNPLTGEWKLIDSLGNKYLIITSKFRVRTIAGKYHIFFFKDFVQRLYRMRLTSDSISMVCSKGLQSFGNSPEWETAPFEIK